jgi:hypothetical protein
MISLTQPIIADFLEKAPVSGAGGFIYNLLPSDRRFEELIYTIYKQKIKNDEDWNNLFDDIYLTAASADSGADCILYKNGKARGVVQCKKYSENLTRPEVAKEILKFVLYTIVDKSLMPEPANFHYYFSVSKGFTKPAMDLISNFNEEIFKEEKIEDWFNDFKRKYSATLKDLNFLDIKEELFSKFKLLKIQKVIPQDLDIELNKQYNVEIRRLFFKIQLVTDNSLLKISVTQILDKINYIPIELSKINLTEKEILQKFETASLQLKEWKGVLANLDDSHIQRNETHKIWNWLSNKLPKEKEPILMLSGNPGFGKSVILKDTLIKLLENNIPVIGIKADRYYAESIEKFNEFTNLKYPLEKLIEILLKKHDKVVVLIDQIDSLSTTATSKRVYLDVYRQLIDNILSVVKDKPEFIKNKIRLVVAIREFDLAYDFEFNFFRKFVKVEVEKFTEEQLEIILEKLNLKLTSLSTRLIDLIRIPSYLEIFCKIYSHGTNLNRINTAMDLMDELWNQETNISKEFNIAEVKSVLYSIANNLYALNQLSIEAKELSNMDTRVMDFLKSRGLILDSQKQIQFFHQTFYDYVFARSFVEKEKSLEEYILTENQSIYVRPTLKIILAFYRQTNFKKYIRIIDRILFSNKYRFHIQLLIIHEIGFLHYPKPEEVSLVTNKLLKRKLFFLPFLESAVGESWFPILCAKKVIDKLIFYQQPKENILLKRILFSSRKKIKTENTDSELYRDLWSSIIRKALKNNQKNAIDYLYELKKFKNDSNTVLWILLGLKKWDYPPSFQVFEKYIENINDDWYSRLSIIEDAADYDYNWAVKQLKIVVEHEPNMGGNHQNSSMYEHLVVNIFEKLSKNNQEKFFEFGIELLDQNISNQVKQLNIENEEEFYITDPIYSSFDFKKDYSDDEDHKLLQLVFNIAIELSQSNSFAFKAFIEKYTDSKYITLQIILIVSYTKAPERYKDNSFKIIKDVLKRNPEERSLNYYIRNLLIVSFIYFAEDQKKEILDIILKLKSKRYEYSLREFNGKKKFHSYFGYLKFEYLSSIPPDEINKNFLVRRVFQELQRRYKLAENKLSEGIRLQSVGPPLVDKAYNYLDLEAWQKTMLQFNGNYKDDSFNDYRGGMTQHSREFARVVQERPEYFYPLLETILTTKTVDDDYIVEGLSALEKASFDAERFLHLYKLAINKVTTDAGIMRIIWLTNYLHKNQLIDEDIFNFLSNQAINSKNPIKVLNIDAPIHDALNSVRGAAISEVVKCYYKKEFAEKIFKIVKAAAKDPIVSVRISALNYMAYLMNLDKEKVLDVFLAYTDKNAEEEILKYSVNTAQYLARYNFKALIPYFKNVLKCESEIENISIILAIAWLNNEPGSYELLQQAWQKSDKAKSKMIDVAVKNFIDADKLIRSKCEQLFCVFLENDAKEIVHEYNGAFLHDMLPIHFEEYYPLIEKYYSSKVALRDPHYYFDYLIKCSKQYPEKCIDLIEYYDKYDKPNNVTGPFYDGCEPVKIVIGALNGLYETKNKNRQYIDKALNLFDEMLKSTIFRGSAFDVLNKV